MPNAYLVAPRPVSKSALPRRLDELPDDLQRLVFKHADASFVVEGHHEDYVLKKRENTSNFFQCEPAEYLLISLNTINEHLSPTMPSTQRSGRLLSPRR
jgi:hypothetical protein